MSDQTNGTTTAQRGEVGSAATDQQPTHRAGEPSGLTWPAEVECPECHGAARVPMMWLHGHPAPAPWQTQACGCSTGRVLNPAIFQTCETCEGTGREWDQEFTGYPCPDCRDANGEPQGVAPRTVRVAEAVQVVERCTDGGVHICYSPGYGVLLHSPLSKPFEDGQTEHDISYLWPTCCAHCDGEVEMDASPVAFGGVPTAQHRDRRGSKTVECGNGHWIEPVRPLPQPGEWWIVGYREAVPVRVVENCDDVPDSPELIEALGPPANIIRYWPEGAVEEHEWTDVTAEFPDGVNVGDWAAVLGPLVLGDGAVRHDPDEAVASP